MRRISDEECKSIIDGYDSGLSMKCLADNFNRSSGHIHYLLTKHGVYKRDQLAGFKRLNFTPEKDEVADIISMYESGITSDKVAIKYSVSQGAILRLLKLKKVSVRPKNYNDKNRKIFFDTKFFDIIDTEAKAYFLGFLMADGNIASGCVRLILHSKDDCVVKKFAECINYPQAKIKYYLYDYRDSTCYFIISSKHMVSSLAIHGCTPRKTFTLKFPTTVPDELMHHFCRGYFDGDGCICKFKNGNCNTYRRSVKILSTYSFLFDFSNTVERLSGSKHTNIYKNGSIFDLVYCRSKDIDKFFDWIYKDATIYLERKYNKFLVK